MKGEGIKEKIEILQDVLKRNGERKLKEIMQGVWRNILRSSFLLSSPEGVKICEEDWDYLILLDACRYDYFKKFNPIDRGNLEKRSSLGTNTIEWYRKNFSEPVDISYVSANPQISEFLLRKNLGFMPFDNLVEVWRKAWNEKLLTVTPQDTTKWALKWIKSNPDKRTLVHYIQPHVPYLFGPRTMWGMRRAKSRAENNEELPKGDVPFRLKMMGVSNKKLRQGYAKNLVYVLKEVKRLIKYLQGKIVITSDHGECFGEYGLYGHPLGIYLRRLTEVPWFVIEKKRSKDIKVEVEGKEEEGEIEDEEEIKRKLRSLGYTQ